MELMRRVANPRFLVALAGGEGAVRPNALFFAGDLGQRIFQQPFSWKTLGVDIRGRPSFCRCARGFAIAVRPEALAIGGRGAGRDPGRIDRLSFLIVQSRPQRAL